MIDNLLSDIGDNTPTLTNPAVVINLAGVMPVNVGQDTNRGFATMRQKGHDSPHCEATVAESRNPVLGNPPSVLDVTGKFQQHPWKNAEASAKSVP